MVFLNFVYFVLPTSYFPDKISIIAVQKLNFSVRNGKRCDPLTESGEQKTQNKILKAYAFAKYFIFARIVSNLVGAEKE